jgi:hypothetical protein
MITIKLSRKKLAEKIRKDHPPTVRAHKDKKKYNRKNLNEKISS